MRARKIAAVAACLSLLFFAAPAVGESAFRLFENLIAAENTTLRFVQTSYDDDGNILDENTGVLHYRRPNRFRLAYDSPTHPLIVSDGETVWFYEAELKQVILRPYETVEHTGLLSMMSGGSLDALRKNYTLSAGVGSSERIFLDATAGDDDESASIRHIRLEFSAADDGRLRRVEITDAFDGRVAMDINEIAHTAVDDGAFQFSPPPNTEVVNFGE